MKKVKDKALAAGKDEVSYYHLRKFDKQYDEILKTSYEENPLPESTAKKRSRQKRSKVLNLHVFFCTVLTALGLQSVLSGSIKLLDFLIRNAIISDGTSKTIIRKGILS